MGGSLKLKHCVLMILIEDPGEEAHSIMVFILAECIDSF